MFVKKNSGNILLIILATAGILTASVGGYFWWTNQKSKVAPVEPVIVQPQNEPTKIDVLANWKTYTTDKFSFKFPANWVVGKFEHFPDMLTLQPADGFVPESQKNSILVSVSNHCLNTQCLTVFNLEEMIKNINAKILSQTTVDKLKAYKVNLTNGNSAYVFINGIDFVLVSTDKYFSETDQILSIFKFL